jgi:dihydroorotate dehydrogenase (fumarate)
MKKLSTKYLGLDLKSPVIVGSCGLSMNIGKVESAVKAGAGAIVLKSIFEEEINRRANFIDAIGKQTPESSDYVLEYTKSNAMDNYLKYIGDVRKIADIPIIASISCVSAEEWINFAVAVEKAGADAIEINLFLLPLDKNRKSADYEETYHSIIGDIVSSVKIPVSVKIGQVFTSTLNFVWEMYLRKVRGVTMFNKFYKSDIDIDTVKTVPDVALNPSNNLDLRWTALVSANVPQIDISASTGIVSGADAIKQLLAGATTVQMVSALYKSGIEHIATVNREISEWMDKHEFESIDTFRGRLNYSEINGNEEQYERTQFMKYHSNYN